MKGGREGGREGKRGGREGRRDREGDRGREGGAFESRHSRRQVGSSSLHTPVPPQVRCEDPSRA